MINIQPLTAADAQITTFLCLDSSTNGTLSVSKHRRINVALPAFGVNRWSLKTNLFKIDENKGCNGSL